ncbi:hypothetical protein Rhe02_23100 [Rhizocola hellebori]|uniref:OmpR/PhoB-type domain-containing protein n=1 Tax=Rhizocola hellebori TaxID=1392758 RepID=A0A8J3VFV7_9ACTN|nr:BTAD domain-containing putative transcriptional regulator [Rhizocola hellebori]GIH04243.1 hypothetical protein Rhe02_23100 [Rhizocola hellebori]
MAVRIRLLGGLDVEGVDFGQLGSRKQRTVLARLALARGVPLAADVLVEAIWPGPDRPQRPGDQLSVLVSRLRSVLGADRLPRVGRGYALHADWLDCDAMAALVTEARRRLTARQLAPARSAIDAAVALDRGPLLPDEPPGDWLDAERAAAARTALTARLTAAEVALESADAWTAAEAAWAALAAEPFAEEALRLLLAALGRSGRAAQGVTEYLAFATRLRDELGVDPAAETTACYVQLLKQPAPVAVAEARSAQAVLPGRLEQLRQLDSAWAQACAGHTVVVQVLGEPGIGKTRLLDSWAASLPGDLVLLRTTAPELGAVLPLQPLLDAFALWLRGQPPQREADLLRGPARWLAPLIASHHDDETASDRMLTIFTGPASAGSGLLQTAVDTVLSRLAGQLPVVLLIDDAHWLDRATTAWLHRVQARLADLPVLIVAALRPDESTARWPLAKTITLGPLDLAAVTEVAGADAAAELYARSAGHPLFLVELMHAGEGELPQSIRDAVADRCDRAGPAAAATLRTAAVLGTEVDLDLMAAVLTEPPEVLLDHLEEGVRRHMLTEHVQGFRFRHQLIREALCAATGPSRTALLHRQAARCLQARGHRADPWDVAHHARLGGDLPLAATALAEAGERAAARFDHGEALRLFDDALSIQDGPQLRLRRARVALPAGRFEQAAGDAGAALAGGVGAEGMEVAAIAAYLLRDFKRCRRLGEDGARLTDDPRLRTSCLALAGRVSHVDGELADAAALLRQAMQEAPPEMQALARLWSAPLHTDLGDPATALQLLDLGVQAAERHPFVQPHRHLAAAEALGQLGRPEAALAELKLVDEVAAQQRTERFTARADNCRAWILRNIGAYAQADELNEAAYARSLGAPGMSEPVADALLGLAEGRLRAGEPGRARELLHRLDSQAGEPHPFAWRHQLQIKLLQGACALADGDTETARTHADEVRAEADRLALPRFQVLARTLAAQANGQPLPVQDLQRVTPLEGAWLLDPAGQDR